MLSPPAMPNARSSSADRPSPDASAPDEPAPNEPAPDATETDSDDALADSDAASDASSEPPVATASRARRMQRRVFRAVLRHLSTSNAGKDGPAPPPRSGGAYARWLPVLRAVPWALAALFGLSFAWDFPGVQISVGRYTLPLDGLLRVVSVSGLIGFGTNWLAITMLFQPREPRPLVGQGVIPAQRERVAYRLAQAVSDELINASIIREKIREGGLAARYRTLALSVADDVLADEVFRHELRALVRRLLQRALASETVQEEITAFTAQQLEEAVDGLPGLALRTYRLLDEDAFQERLREAVRRLPHSVDPMLDRLDPLLDRLPAELAKRGDTLEELITQTVLRFVEQLDIERIVLDNVRGYDERQLEALLKRTTNEQLTYIKYLGGVLGMAGGLVIWAPLAALAGFAALGAVVYALDEALHRAQRAS